MERLNFQRFTPTDMTMTISLTSVGTVSSSTLVSVNVRMKVRGHHVFVAVHCTLSRTCTGKKHSAEFLQTLLASFLSNSKRA